MLTHNERAAKMYGAVKPAAKPAAAPKPAPKAPAPAAAEKAARAARASQQFDRAVNGSIEPLLIAARSKNDRLEAERLERTRDQLAQFCSEMHFNDGQAMQFVSGVLECQRRPRTRKELVENDQAYFVSRYGADVAAVMSSAATRAAQLLADKPDLLLQVRQTGAAIHRDCVEPALEAVVAADLVKPLEVQKQ